DRSAFVDPALEYARSGQSFTIEGGPGLGKRTLAQMAAGQSAERGPIVTIDAGDSPNEALADAREEQPATWILANADKLPRPVLAELGQTLARATGAIAIATLESPLDRALGDGVVAPGFATIFNGRRLSISPLSARRENIPGIVWSLARKLGISASR